jgi:hypothetical protein
VRLSRSICLSLSLVHLLHQSAIDTFVFPAEALTTFVPLHFQLQVADFLLPQQQFPRQPQLLVVRAVGSGRGDVGELRVHGFGGGGEVAQGRGTAVFVEQVGLWF